MSIAAEMVPPLVLLARVQATLAQMPGFHVLAHQMECAIACLTDAAERVEALDGNPVPQHWLPQRSVTLEDLQAGDVASLLEARLRARANGGKL